MSLKITSLFTSTLHIDKLHSEIERSINTAIHSRYGNKAKWHGNQWLVPMPKLRFEAKPIPKVTFAIQGYLVSVGTVETRDDFYSVTLVGPIGKPEMLVLPLPFLQAMLDDDLEHFEIVGRDGTHTAWNIPGFKEAIRLPNDFTARLSDVLRLESVAEWLLDFGAQGKSIAPLVVGTLIGLQLHGVIEPLPVGQQQWKREGVLDTLTQMFGTARAKEMLEQEAPYLKANMSNEEVIRLILEEAGREYKR